METKHTKEYARELAIKHQAKHGGHASDFSDGYMTAIKHTAAPDLLEALIKLSSEYKMGADCGDWGNWKAEEQPEYIQAINAIKKATE